MARRHHLLSPLGKLPFLEQPAADRGVVDTEALLLALDQRRLAPLLRAEARVDLGHGMIERHDADVLDQTCEEQLLAVLDADDASEHVARRCAEQRAAPVERIVEAAGLVGRLPGFQQRERQRERDRGVQADDHQRLLEILGLALARVHRRVGDAQNFGGDGGIEGEDIGDARDVDLRIVGELDDLRRDSGGARQTVAAFDLFPEFWRNQGRPPFRRARRPIDNAGRR